MRRARGRVSEYLLKPLDKKVILVVTVIVIATELFMVTDIGPFRFSIGTVVFVYVILSLNHLLIIPTAVLVAVSTLLLRVGLDYFFRLPRDYFTFMTAYQYSGVIYFLLLPILLKPGRIREGACKFSAPLVLYLGGAVTVSNLAEALVRVPYQKIIAIDNTIILVLMSSAYVF